MTLLKNLFLLSAVVLVTPACNQSKKGTSGDDKKGDEATSPDAGASDQGATKAGEFILTYNDISEFEGSSLTFQARGKSLKIQPGEGAGCVILKQADFNSLQITFQAANEVKSCSNVDKQLSVNPRVRKPGKCYTKAFYGHKKITLTGRGAFMGALAGGRYKLSIEDREDAFQPDPSLTCKTLPAAE